MYIFKEAETPQGVAANCHRVHKLEITGDKFVVTLNSFANETSEMLIWQDQYELPMKVFTSGTYPQNVYDFLIDETLGPFPSGALIAEMEELEKLKLTKRKSIDSMREKQIASGCTTPSGVVDTDEKSVRNILGSYQAATLALMTSSAFEIQWRMTDNSLVDLDAQEMIALGNAVLARTKACYEHSWNLKDELDDPETDTVEKVNDIQIETGWPEI